MANLLNFNASRDLGFSHLRELEFDLNRTLNFDPNRDLVFQPNRDLGFGKRGVLFRGYACPNCGAIVSPDATSCSECGAEFQTPEIRGAPLKAVVQTSKFEREGEPAPAPPPQMPPPPAPRSAPLPPPPMRASPRPPAPTPTAAPSTTAPSASRFCPNCGARSWQGDMFCWNCGARFTGSAKVVTTSPTGAGVPSTAESVQLPPKKVKKVTKDWQDTGKSLSEYAEEK